METKYRKSFSWDFYSRLIIVIYCLFQVLRWRILPQFMDIYYHILNAWGFIKAGGYSGWDFWQYAPVGRINIYPPAFHIILSIFMKAGVSAIILAKFFETALPAALLIVLWKFLKDNYNERLAFFTILVFGSSFSFYLSLLNHLPATLTLIFGFLSLGQLFRKNYLGSLLLLTLCFYTHIGLSWFFAFSFIILGFSNREHKGITLKTLICALTLSMPVLFKELVSLRFVTTLGFNLNEKYLCQLKIADYALALFGLILALKGGKKYRLFLSFFLASLIFLLYPYRFFSAEGFLPIVLLSALALNRIYEKSEKNRYIKLISILAVSFILFISPTISIRRPSEGNGPGFKLHFFDSAFTGMLLARGQTSWFPQEYLFASALIKNNSEEGDIIYSSLNISGIALAAISGRATANALLPEIKPHVLIDPFAVSKIIIFPRDEDTGILSRIIDNYDLVKIGENKMFILYRNPASLAKINIKKASLSFRWIGLIGFVFLLLFVRYAKGG